MNKILVVSPFFVLPNNHGGKTDVLNRVIALHDLGFLVDFLYTEEDEINDIKLIEELKKYVNNIFYCNRESGLRSMLSLNPFQVKSRQSLSEIKILQNYDYTILEGDYVGEILNNKYFDKGKVVLRVHNNETKYFINMFKSSIPSWRALYYLSDAIKFLLYSKKLFKKLHNFLYISDVERISNDSIIKNNSITLLTDFPSSKFLTNEIDKCNVLFLGSLYAPNNVEGISWYLKNIHSKLIELGIDYSLTIVGSLNGTTFDKNLKELIENSSNVSLHLDVPDVSRFYSTASVFINPMLRGAGVKVKSIEAVVNGLALVSTSVGVEGIGFTNNIDVLVANDTKEFFEAIKRVLLDKELRQTLVKNSQNFIASKSHKNLLNDFFHNTL